MATPNVYADQIEWFCRNVKNGVTSLMHQPAPAQRSRHRGRGGRARAHGRVRTASRGRSSATASAPVTWMSVTLAGQPASHRGSNPESRHLRRRPRWREVSEYCTQLPVHPRHPYAGELVFTAFSGSHQDAIKKGMAAHGEAATPGSGRFPTCRWIPRTSEAPTRPSSASTVSPGRAVSPISSRRSTIWISRGICRSSSARSVQRGDGQQTSKEITAEGIWDAVPASIYLDRTDARLEFLEYWTRARHSRERTMCRLSASIKLEGEERTINGKGQRTHRRFRRRARRRTVAFRFERARTTTSTPSDTGRMRPPSPTWRPRGRQKARSTIRRRNPSQHRDGVAARRRECRETGCSRAADRSQGVAPALRARPACVSEPLARLQTAVSIRRVGGRDDRGRARRVVTHDGERDRPTPASPSCPDGSGRGSPARSRARRRPRRMTSPTLEPRLVRRDSRRRDRRPPGGGSTSCTRNPSHGRARTRCVVPYMLAGRRGSASARSIGDDHVGARSAGHSPSTC